MSRCHHDNPATQKFCGECGARLLGLCPACGGQNAPTQKFCGECGERLLHATTEPKSASPDTYTPRHLAEKILTSKAALEGERKLVTVLFADTKGSMEILADLDPEEARQLLDGVIATMIAAVHRYEGTVSNVMGDGVMALFGAPLAHEDHAARACYAALSMQQSARMLAESVRRAGGPRVQIRVGLNSGEVVVGSISNDLHMDYTAVGRTTHLAARMEQLADPGSILLTSETLTLVEGFVQVTALGPVAVKGLPVPVDVYELTGVGAVRSRLQGSAGRGLSRFVGRDAEIDQLRRALEHAGLGRGQVTAVVGEPGVGKSRLVFELTHSHRVDGWLVLESGSVSYGKATSYLPIVDLLKGYFRIGDHDTYRDIREKLTGKILTLDRSLEPTLPALFALLDAPVDDPEWQVLDPSQRRQRTLDTVKRLLLREAQVQPLLLIFEDLHWIDSETQAFLDSLVESLPTARMLLLVNYRPEYAHGWGSKTFYTQLRLDTLPPGSADELLDTLLGADASLEPLKALLATQTGRNPLFLEESIRTLVEIRALVGERGAYRLAQPVETVRVPATVQAILASRIDRLPPEEKRLLETAAVIGKDVRFALLHTVAAESEEALRRGLSHLQAAEFLYETSLFPDLEYTFKHALTHQVAYESLLHNRRRSLHVRILETLEALYPDRLPEHIEVLAYHALQGERWEKAVGYLRQVGLRATARSANREAVARLEQALETLHRLPESRTNTEVAIDLRLKLRTALLPLADVVRMERHLREAETLARVLGDARRLGEALAGMVMPRMNTGDWDEAQQSGREALAIAEALGDQAMAMRTTLALCMLHDVRGEFSQAVGVLERIVASLGDDLRHERLGAQDLLVGNASIVSVFSRVYLCNVLSQLGRFDEAIAHAEVAVRIAEAADHPFSLCLMLVDLGLSHLGRGDVPHATRVLERCFDLCGTWQVAVLTPFTSAALGAAYAFAGRLDEALPLVDRAVEEFRGRTLYRRPGLVFLLAGMTYLRAGRIGEASAVAREVLELTRRLGARGNEAHALCLSGDTASAAAAEDAEGYYRSGLALANDLGMRPLIARCHLGLGKLCRRTGKREQAQEHLTTATSLFREMGMRFWLERVEAEIKDPRPELQA